MEFLKRLYFGAQDSQKWPMVFSLSSSDPAAFSDHHEEPYPFIFRAPTLAQPHSARHDSAERPDDFAVSGLRERLQRLRAHEAEAPELQDVTGHDGVVRRLANSDKVELAHHHVKLLHLAAHVGK